ncbi:MAG: hypothetical protein JWO03_3834 [Bacteroidetes bacterium]|nr:hypothetical protein [Bacteroidota bacterium]
MSAGCDHRAGSNAVHYGFADSIAVDSMTLWQQREGNDKKSITAWVFDTVAAVYTLRGEHLYLDTVLRLADSVTVTKDEFERYFSNKFYAISYHGRQGYMRGTSLGLALESDFDNDGRQDLILYGYSHYQKDTFEENPENPLSVKFISSAGLVSEVHDTASSNLSLTEVGHVRLSKTVHVYELNAGYEACGYPQYHFIIAFGNGKAEIIHRKVTSIDSGYGDYCQFYYPTDSTHRIDTIYISHRLSEHISETDDTTIIEHTADSTILYLHQGAWGEKNYKLDPKSN